MNLPNKLTMLRMALIPVFVVLMLADQLPAHFLWAFCVFAAASFTDLLDGKIARSRGLVTDFGKLMDPLADKLLVMSALVCFVGLNLVPSWVVVIILSREFLVTSIRLIAAPKGRVIAADLFGKLKTVFQMGWMGYLMLWCGLDELGYITGGQGWGIHLLLMGITVALTALSGFNYVWKNRDLLADA